MDKSSFISLNLDQLGRCKFKPEMGPKAGPLGFGLGLGLTELGPRCLVCVYFVE